MNLYAIFTSISEVPDAYVVAETIVNACIFWGSTQKTKIYKVVEAPMQVYISDVPKKGG